jgi:hypothetical protein
MNWDTAYQHAEEQIAWWKAASVTEIEAAVALGLTMPDLWWPVRSQLAAWAHLLDEYGYWEE